MNDECRRGKNSTLSVGYSIFIIQQEFCNDFAHDLTDKGLMNKSSIPENSRHLNPVFVRMVKGKFCGNDASSKTLPFFEGQLK
jgi:hypothetical protein